MNAVDVMRCLPVLCALSIQVLSLLDVQVQQRNGSQRGSFVDWLRNSNGSSLLFALMKSPTILHRPSSSPIRFR